MMNGPPMPTAQIAQGTAQQPQKHVGILFYFIFEFLQAWQIFSISIAGFFCDFQKEFDRFFYPKKKIYFRLEFFFFDF